MTVDRNTRNNIRVSLKVAAAQLHIAEAEAADLAAANATDPLGLLLPQIEVARALADQLAEQTQMRQPPEG